MDSAPPIVAPVSVRRTLWQRRVVAPIVAQLTQGITPDKITQTLAISSVLAVFPILGTTWALNLAVGVWLRLNQPIMQVLNQLLAPLHLALIIVYVRLGEQIWQVGEERLDLAELTRSFHEKSFGEFLQQFGMAGVHAITAWALTAPLLYFAIYFALRPILRRFSWKRAPAPVP